MTGCACKKYGKICTTVRLVHAHMEGTAREKEEVHEEENNGKNGRDGKDGKNEMVE